jgi:cell division protein FtsB
MHIGRILHQKWTARLIIVLTLFMTFSLGINAWKMSHKPDHSQEESAELEKLQQQKDTLQSNISQHQQPFEKEKVIRDELNMQKEGETIIQLPNLPTPTPYPTFQPSPSPKVYKQWIKEVF